MDIEIEVASKSEFKRDFNRLTKGLSTFHGGNRPPFGITRASINNSRLLIGRVIIGCLEIPAEEIEKSDLRGAFAALVLYPLAYYLFHLYLFLLAVEIIFAVITKIFG